jgi:hypothetical protein
MTAGNRSATAIMAGTCLLSISSGTCAQEFCVSCMQPDAVYRCVIDNARPASGTPLQVLCLTRMSEYGKHASCAIKRVTVLDCDGQIVHITTPPPSGDAGATTGPPGPAPEPKDRKKTDTLLGVMKEAGKTSKEQLDSAGAALGKGAKKSWDCVTSFFSKC